MKLSIISRGTTLFELRRSSRAALMLCGLLIFASELKSDTITGVGTGANAGSWQATGWKANRTGEYFDNASSDEPQGLIGGQAGCGIAFYVTGNVRNDCTNQATNTMSTGPGSALSYWGAGQVADTGFYFSAVTSPSFTISLMVEAAGRRDVDEVGIFFLNNPSLPILKLFDGTDSPTKSVTFTPGTLAFGFYFKIAAAAGGYDIYYSDSTRAGTAGYLNTDVGKQHFAVFQQPNIKVGSVTRNQWWVGMENTPSAGSPDNDYNDTMVRMYCNNCDSGASGLSPRIVPEPGTIILAGAGLASLWHIRRRRQTRA